jgi:hypothetical protein
MKRLLSITILGCFALLCSCKDASFTEVTPAPVSDYWFTSESPLRLNGRIKLHDYGGGYIPLPANAAIIAAWEVPNGTNRLLYVYGKGAISKIGRDDYHFDILLGDTLPKFILAKMDTTNALAACHIFLTSNSTLTTGDTLRYDIDWDYKYQVIGSMNDIGVIFIKGNPPLPGQRPAGMLPPGFNILHAKKIINPNPPNGPTFVTDFDPFPFNVEIEVNDDGRDCKGKTPFWLQ